MASLGLNELIESHIQPLLAALYIFHDVITGLFTARIWLCLVYSVMKPWCLWPKIKYLVGVLVKPLPLDDIKGFCFGICHIRLYCQCTKVTSFCTNQSNWFTVMSSSNGHQGDMPYWTNTQLSLASLIFRPELNLNNHISSDCGDLYF